MALYKPIPQFESNIRLSHRFRFTASSALSLSSITGATLLGALGTVCTVVNTTVAQFARAFRIKSVEMWAPISSTSTAPVSCTIVWFGFGNSPNIERTGTSISNAQPAHLRSTPPKESLAGFWQLTGSTNIFFLTAPGGTVVDLEVEYVLVDQATATSTQTVAAGTLGNVYYLALDGPTTNLLVPVGLATTA